MTGRIVAVGLLLILVGIVGAFMIGASMTPREDAQMAASNSGAPIGAMPKTNQRIRGKLGSWQLEGQLMLTTSAAYELLLHVADVGGQPAPATFLPTVRLDMVDHGMTFGLIRVDVDGPGTYRATGTFEMTGRWRIRIGGAGDEVELITDFRR